VAHINSQEVVGELIKLLDTLNMRSNNSLLFLEHTDVTVHFDVGKLLIAEITQSGWHLVLTLVVEQNVESTGIIVYFKLGTHGLFYTSEDAAA